MSTRLATDSRGAVTLRERRRANTALITGATVAVSIFALAVQNQSVGRLAISLTAGLIGGALVGLGARGRRRTALPERTVAAYVVRSAALVVVGVILLTAFGLLIGATAALTAGLLAGTLAETAVSRRRLDP